MEPIKPNRRKFLGLLGVGLAAPMIVKVASIMPAKAMPLVLWTPEIVNPVPVLSKEMRMAWLLSSNGKFGNLELPDGQVTCDANGIWYAAGSHGR